MWAVTPIPALPCNLGQHCLLYYFLYCICTPPAYELAPVPLSIFRSNLKFDENSERFSFEYTGPITTIFCTRHDSDTVVTCAKYRVYFTLECFQFSSNFEFDRNMLSGTGARSAAWHGSVYKHIAYNIAADDMAPKGARRSTVLVLREYSSLVNRMSNCLWSYFTHEIITVIHNHIM